MLGAKCLQKCSQNLPKDIKQFFVQKKPKEKPNAGGLLRK
jgi:hypothetical protein